MKQKDKIQNPSATNKGTLRLFSDPLYIAGNIYTIKKYIVYYSQYLIKI